MKFQVLFIVGIAALASAKPQFFFPGQPGVAQQFQPQLAPGNPLKTVDV